MNGDNEPPVDDAVNVVSIDSPGRAVAFRAITTFVTVEPVLIVIVLIMVGVPKVTVALFAGAGLAIVAGLFWLITLTIWKPMQRCYPAQPIRPGAVSRSWQTFGFGGFLRLSNCLMIVADERHLHLTPFAPLRWTGARRMSLPLDRITDVWKAGLPGFDMSARLDDRLIFGPEWCLRLAAPQSEIVA